MSVDRSGNAIPSPRKGYLRGGRRLARLALWSVLLGVFLALGAVLISLLVVWISPPGGRDGAATEIAKLMVAVRPNREPERPKVNPAEDGWESEVFSSAAEKQLKDLSKLLEHPAEINIQRLSQLATPEFSCDSLLPKGLVEVFQDSSLTVFRPAGTTDSASEHAKDPGYQGLSGLAEALRTLVRPLEDSSEVRANVKIFRVDTTPTSATTRVYFQASGRNDQGAVQQNATWRCRWERGSPQQPPLLAEIGVERYELVVYRGQGGRLLADCTESVLGSDPSFATQLRRGIDQWWGHLDAILGIDAYGHHGIAVGDVNGDGLDDLYVCQPGGLPDRLFVQNQDGTASEVSTDAGVAWLDASYSALLVDLDNDGDQDLAVVLGSSLVVMSNDGSGRFSRRSVVRNVLGGGMLTAADYDRDGDLDLYVCCFRIDGDPIPYHDANNGAPNVLLRNDSQWVFTDVTHQSGLEANNHRFSFAASWEDYDNDGDMDLYVANDYGRNNLYRNDGGYFIDIAARAGVEDVSAGMSASWADYNNDGLMDLYIGNMFSSAGNRITYHRRFKTNTSESTRALLRRHARGNSLFENAGDGTFRDVSISAAVTMGRWAWGSKFADLNNDGLEDLVVANGFITGENTGDL